MKAASHSLTKRVEPVFMRLTVVKISFRPAWYQQVAAPSFPHPDRFLQRRLAPTLRLPACASRAAFLSELALVTFPARLHLCHELFERRVFADPIEKRVALKERVTGEAVFSRIAEPPQGLFALSALSENAGDPICVMMITPIF